MRNKKIYVVDDEPESAQLVLAALMEVGFMNIELFYGPDTLIYSYDFDNPPDLVISDFRMDPESGVEMFERIRMRSGQNKVPRMLLMSRFEVDLWEGDFLKKPFKRGLFIQKLQERVLEIFQVSHLW